MRVAIVNDVPLCVEAMRRAVDQVAGHQVIWVAGDGEEAVRRAVADTPDLILMDLVMPRMDGVQATRAIMRDAPCAILIVTAAVERLTGKVFEALAAGALDAVDTPVLGGPEADRSLHNKINTIARLLGPRPGPQTQRGSRAIVIGASSGGPGALANILGKLPSSFPVPVVIVQHIDANFIQGLADWLSVQTPLKVVLASDKTIPAPGNVYLAGGNQHLIVNENGALSYTPKPEDSLHRPSVDVFFSSLALQWSGELLGVILTGMGSDGARGLLALRKRGFATIAQDEASSSIFGMPRAAIKVGAAKWVLPLPEIPAQLLKFARVTA